MAQIRIQNNTCWLSDEPDLMLLRRLDEELSFRIQGAEHIRSFKSGHWDGVQHLLTGDLSFPIGLLDRVVNFYKRSGAEPTLLDLRPAKTPLAPLDILPRLKELGKNPYPYQLEAVKSAQAVDHGIIRIATGGGKTVVAALLTASFGKKTIIYVIGKDLLHQTHGFFSQVFDQPIGIIGDGICEIHDINIASIWSVGQALGIEKNITIDGSEDEEDLDPEKYKAIREMLSSAKVQLLDECHIASCSTIQTIAKNIEPEYIYGMSASPWRDDNSDLLIECILGSSVVDISASYLIERGFLVRPIIKFITVPKHTEKLKKHYQTIYKNYIVENPVRNALVVKGAQKLVEQGYKTLVLFSSIAHGELLYREISKLMPCALLSGKDSAETRELAKKQIESGEIKCLIASKILDIGVDVPCLSGLVLAGGGKSSVRALQRIGRVIRKYPNKKQAAVIDFYDQAAFLKEHSLERKKIYQTEERFQII